MSVAVDEGAGGRAAVGVVPPARRRPGSSRRPPPRPGSLPVTASDDGSVGDTGLGRIAVQDGVVGKVAARAALDVDDVGAAAPRLFGRDLPAAPGVRSTELGALPSSTAQVDGELAFVSLTISVRYPAPVRQVAAAVRESVRAQVLRLTGLQVAEVDITVAALVRELPTPPRVR